MNFLFDTLILSKRCLRLSFRHLDVIIVSAVLPVMMLLAFVFLFGGGMEMGRDNYTNFVVPGILILATGYCASLTAQNVQADMAKGVIDRFRSMPMAHSAFLVGHVLASIVRSLLSMALVIVVALLSGFRPEATIGGWLIIVLMLILYLLVVTWFSVFIGLIAKTPESAGSFGFIILFLPYLSSGFVEPATLHAPLRVIAQNQPMTHIIDAVRNVSLGIPLGNEIWFALVWCIVLLVIGYLLSVSAYKKKAS
jgi:ABC-2 type transport system permease protein